MKASTPFPLAVVAASACLLGSVVVYLYCNHQEYKSRDRNNRDDKSKTGSNKAKENELDGCENRDSRKKTDRSCDGSGGDDDASFFDLPQHLQRELYKEERRKASVRFLAMKKPLYENIEMYGPDGTTMLCTIGTKKANWYVRKELAVWRDIPDCHPSIRLLFEPKNSKNCKINRKKTARANRDGESADEVGSDEKLREYNCTHKLNICVSCGAKDASECNNNNNNNNLDGTGKNNNIESNNDDDDAESFGATAGLMRHYVVPYAYRKLLPAKFKTHLPHDVVLLCLDCHIDAEQATKIHRTDVYEKLYRKDPSTRLAVVIDHDRKRLKSYAKALWKYKHKLPPERIKQYESTIKEYLASEKPNLSGSTCSSTTHRSDGGSISENALRDLALNIQPERPNPKYIPLADLVVRNLCQTDEAIAEFVIGWRQFFAETLRPRHMPTGWSVHSPVQVDVMDDDREIVEANDEE